MQLKLFSRSLTWEVDSFEKCGRVCGMVIDIILFSFLLPLDVLDEHDMVFTVLLCKQVPCTCKQKCSKSYISAMFILSVFLPYFRQKMCSCMNIVTVFGSFQLSFHVFITSCNLTYLCWQLMCFFNLWHVCYACILPARYFIWNCLLHLL